MAEPITDLEKLSAEVNDAAEEIGKRNKLINLLEKYAKGEHPIPDAIKLEKKTKAYMRLMEMARTNWPKVTVRSFQERLKVQRIRYTDDEVTKLIHRAWQANAMNSEFKLALRSALTIGRAYLHIWADENDEPIIDVDHASTTIVRYVSGSRRKRAAAVRIWSEGESWFATLYHPHFTYRLEGAEKGSAAPSKWVPRKETGDDEPWTIENPFGLVQVVEIAINRDTKWSKYGSAAGTFEDALGHIDRINYTVFSLLVAMTWSGFPLRAKIGDPILYEDDDKTPIKPFDVAADSLVQIENPDGKLMQLPEAQLKNFLDAMAAFTRDYAAIVGTPAHYMIADLINIAADAIRASEARLNAICDDLKEDIGEDILDATHLLALVFDPDAQRDPFGTVQWADLQSRSMAERADAAVKLKDLIPWQTIAMKYLGFSPDDVTEMETQKASDALGLALPNDLKMRAEAMGVLVTNGMAAEDAAALVGLEGHFNPAEGAPSDNVPELVPA